MDICLPDWAPPHGQVLVRATASGRSVHLDACCTSRQVAVPVTAAVNRLCRRCGGDARRHLVRLARRPHRDDRTYLVHLERPLRLPLPAGVMRARDAERWACDLVAVLNAGLDPAAVAETAATGVFLVLQQAAAEALMDRTRVTAFPVRDVGDDELRAIAATATELAAGGLDVRAAWAAAWTLVVPGTPAPTGAS